MAKDINAKKHLSGSAGSSQTPVPEHPSLDEVYEETPFSEAFWTYLNYIMLNIFGWFRDVLRKSRIENRKGSAEYNPPVRLAGRPVHHALNLIHLGLRSTLSKLRELLHAQCLPAHRRLLQSTDR